MLEVAQWPGPLAVVAKANSVWPDESVVESMTKPSARFCRVATRLKVNHYARLCARGSGCSDAGVHELGHGAELGVGPLVQLAVGPEQSVGNLVSDLHPSRRGLLSGETVQNRGRVTCDFCHQLGLPQISPGRRFRLVRWVGPPIAVVKVENQLQPSLLDSLGQREGLGERTVLARRAHPKSHSGSG